MSFGRSRIQTSRQPPAPRSVRLPHVVTHLLSLSSILTIYRPFRQVLGYVFRSPCLSLVKHFSGIYSQQKALRTLRALLLLGTLPRRDADSKVYRTQIFPLSSIPIISYSSNSTSATFLLHLIPFHPSRLHSSQYTVRMVQERPVHPTQGSSCLERLVVDRGHRTVPTGSMPTQLISAATILAPKAAASWSKATKIGLFSASLHRDTPKPPAQK